MGKSIMQKVFMVQERDNVKNVRYVNGLSIKDVLVNKDVNLSKHYVKEIPELKVRVNSKWIK